MKGPVLQLVVLLATLAAASPGSARPDAFSGNVCGLLTAKQVTAIGGVTASCKNGAPLPGPGSKQYTGNWAGATPKSPQLQVTVAAFTSTDFLKRAVQNLRQGLPGGTPKKVTGIGDGAYEAKGPLGPGIHVALGKYVAYLSLTAVGGPPPTLSQLEPIAKDVAAKLS